MMWSRCDGSCCQKSHQVSLCDGLRLLQIYTHMTAVCCALHVYKNADVPADILYLAGSDKATDAAFVETASLDGETNLKQKECYKGTRAACTVAELAELSSTSYVKCARPNDR